MKNEPIRRYLLLTWTVRPEQENWLLDISVFKTREDLDNAHKRAVLFDSSMLYGHLEYSFLILEQTKEKKAK